MQRRTRRPNPQLSGSPRIPRIRPTTSVVQPYGVYRAGAAFQSADARMRIDPIKNGVRVTNREIVLDVTRSATAGAVPSGVDSLGYMFVDSSTVAPSPGAGQLGTNLWIGQYAKLYDKFIPRKTKFEFVSSLPFTAVGQVGHYFDSDPNPVAPTTFRGISGNVYAQSVHCSQPQELTLRPNQMDRLPQYQASANATDATTGRVGVYQLVNTPITLPTSTTGTVSIGVVWMEYEVDFLNPSNPQTASPATVIISSEKKSRIDSQVIADARPALDKLFSEMRINVPVSQVDNFNKTLTPILSQMVLANLRKDEL